MKKSLAVLCLAVFSGLATAQPVADALFAATLGDLDGRPIGLARYRGKPLVVNFWARWCPPCRAEIPELVRFGKTNKGRIEVLGIGIEDKAMPVKEFARDNNIDYPLFVAADKGIPLMQNLGNTVGGLPYTLFIDGDGRIIGKKMGRLSRAELDAAAALLLKR